VKINLKPILGKSIRAFNGIKTENTAGQAIFALDEIQLDDGGRIVFRAQEIEDSGPVVQAVYYPPR
jgi:hypothetical protein